MTTSMERLAAGTEVRAWVSSQGRPGGTWVRAHGLVRDVVVAIDDAGGAREVLRTTDAAWLAGLDAVIDGDGELQSAVVTTLAAGVPVTVAGRLVSAIAVDVAARVEHVASSLLASAAAPVAAPPAVVAARPAASSASAPVSAGPRAMPAPTPTRTAPAAPQAPRTTASPVPAPRPLATAASPASWAAVSAASDRVKAGASDEPEPIEIDELERGDLLMHPTLGRCTFLQVADTDAIKVKLGNGSPQKLMMRVFDVLPTDTARVFKLRKRD